MADQAEVERQRKAKEAAAAQAEAQTRRDAEAARVRALPKSRSTLRVFNAYADSLISAYLLLYETGERLPLLVDGRIPSSRWTEFPGVIEAPQGVRVGIHFESMSLGDRHNLGSVDGVVSDGGTISAQYDYDMATGKFVVGVQWPEGAAASN